MPLLKKFAGIMEEAKKQLEAKDSASVSSQKSSVLQTEGPSDAVSVVSVNESKFGDLLLNNPNLKYSDVQRLIKDNFPYFKHIFGYCLCYKSGGMTKCAHILKGTRRIKFRGNFVSLYS